MAADGKNISHSSLVMLLLKAIQLPKTLAIVHCRAHTGQQTEIARENALADFAAKQAAISQTADIQMAMLIPDLSPFEQSLADLQDYASNYELRDWDKKGVQKDPKNWTSLQRGETMYTSGKCITLHLTVPQNRPRRYTGHSGSADLLSRDFYILKMGRTFRDHKRRCTNISEDPHSGNHSSMGMPTSNKLRQWPSFHGQGLPGLGKNFQDRMEVPHSLPTSKLRDSRKNEQKNKRQKKDKKGHRRNLCQLEKGPPSSPGRNKNDPFQNNRVFTF